MAKENTLQKAKDAHLKQTQETLEKLNQAKLLRTRKVNELILAIIDYAEANNINLLELAHATKAIHATATEQLIEGLNQIADQKTNG